MRAKHCRFRELAFMAGFLCLLVGLFFANRLLINEIPVPQNFDEVIPMRVSQHMAQGHALDTDWAHAELPEDFRRVHFNFSGYVLSAYAFVSVVSAESFGNDERLLSRLRQFSRYADLLLLLVTFALLYPLWGTIYALLASVAVLLAPLVFQDAHYARPESLGTLLFTACFLIALQRRRSQRMDAWRAAAICAFMGFLASIKITYVPGLAFVLPIASPYLGDAWKAPQQRVTLFYVMSVCAAIFVFGIVAGAPKATTHLSTYFSGLQALRAQYAGGHPPHSLSNYSLTSQAGWILAYFVATLGSLSLLIHTLGYLDRTTRPACFAFLAIAGGTFTFFAFQHVFFERNFSHLVPGFLIISVGGIRWLESSIVTRYHDSTWIRGAHIAVRILLAVGLLRTSYGMTQELRHVFSREDVQAEQTALHAHIARIAGKIRATRTQDVGYAAVFDNSLPMSKECTLYKVTTYNDDWSRHFLQSLPKTMKIDHVGRSRFTGVPTSTLHTYHSPTIYLMHNPDQCQDDPA